MKSWHLYAGREPPLSASPPASRPQRRVVGTFCGRVAVAEAVAREVPTLPRAAIAGASWEAHGAIIVVRDWDEAVGLVNRLEIGRAHV